ncbi:MAG: AMP-binding protein [Gammaproteobacteria bacterium]|nr:AMP-binding protein [Gammaproteobacteria bacterium]
MRTLDDTQLYLPELWATHAEFYPEKTAVICGDRRVSWRSLNEGFNRVANSLIADGVKPGDKVAVLMTNSVEMLEVMFGIVKARACLVPLSALLTAEQLATLIDDSDACMIIASGATADLASQAVTRCQAGKLRRKVAMGFEQTGWEDGEHWLAEADSGEPPLKYDLRDEFNIIYSSGTTGIPKGIVQTHRARQHWSYSNALELRFDANSIALATTSLYSNGTWFMVLPPMFLGATMVIMEQFSPRAFLETVEREGVTHTFMVPTQYITTLADETFDQRDLSPLKVMLSAGSPLRQDTKDEIVRRMGPGLFELYGFSEGFATIIRPEQMHKRGSVGTPVTGFQLRILDDQGNSLPRGEAGEIAGYGAGLMKEYYKRPEATAEAVWIDERGRSFLRSGDIGRQDEDGFLYILDRKKDMIISGGFNVFPKDIEEVIGAHPEVSDVTVIGIPHDKWGEAPLALIIPEKGTTPDPEAVRSWANARLAKTQRLAAVELRDEFPRNALGKVLKRHLREPYWT